MSQLPACPKSGCEHSSVGNPHMINVMLNANLLGFLSVQVGDE
jgi:hypothetical protein